MNEVKPFDTSKLFKEFRGLWVLNKKYYRTEKRNVTERLPLSKGIFINDWSNNERSRIGGKGMTRERDRIQKNANEYIVKNCPCLFNSYYASGKTVRFECNDGNHDDKLCRDVTDCVIKQVIEKCKNTCRKRCTNDCLGTKKHCGYGEILQLFDIEEIKE